MAFSKLSIPNGRYSLNGDLDGGGHPYDSDRPGLPAGDPYGGQWTSGWGRLDTLLGRTVPDSGGMSPGVRPTLAPSDTTRVAQAGNIAKTGARSHPEGFHRIEQRYWQMHPNEAAGKLLNLQDKEPDRVIRGEDAVVGALPGATIAKEGDSIIVTNGRAIGMSFYGEAFEVEVTGDDRIVIDPKRAFSKSGARRTECTACFSTA